jgi:hypothetical protein
VPVRNLSSATELRQGWSTGLRRPGSKAERGRGIEFPNLRTLDVGRGRDPIQAVVGSEVSRFTTAELLATLFEDRRH